jgi:leader peptidase (prepilin peptidase) / N-methyltransferase
MQYTIPLIIFIYGAIFGSFFNVVIFRVPKKESIIHHSSHCPKCMETIKPYDLIPIVSYLILGGKCRNCKSPISKRYPIIESLTGISYVLVYLVFGLTYQTLIGIILASILIIITMIDIDTLEILDRFQIMLLVLALGNLFVTPLPFIDHLIGFFSISILFYIIAYISGGIGGGDIKLIAIAGLLLGYKATLVAFFIASILGGSVAIYLLATKQKERKSMIAFGPYLCIGIYFAYLYGNQIFSWYLSLFS